MSGSEFIATTDTRSSDYRPDVAALVDGGFTISWDANYSDDYPNHNYGIVARQFDSEGQPVSNATLVGGKADDLIVLSDGQIGANVDLGEGTDSLTLGDIRDAVTVTNVESVDLGAGDDSQQ